MSQEFKVVQSQNVALGDTVMVDDSFSIIVSKIVIFPLDNGDTGYKFFGESGHVIWNREGENLYVIPRH